jgi:hypothetical protein
MSGRIRGEGLANDRGVRTLAWRRIDESSGYSMARVERRATGWLCHGAEVLTNPKESFACNFRIWLDRDWVTRDVEVHAVSKAGENRLSLKADAKRDWRRDGQIDPALTGCVDVDVAATPLTNTFPIRRFASVAVGEQRTSPVAWVEVPTLRVIRVEQSYRRLGPQRWQYSDPMHGAFELSVDDEGLVIDYEGFASRVW